MYTDTLWVSHSHNADTTSRNTTHYEKHQHSVSYSQENHFHVENVTFSQMLDDFMLVQVSRPVQRPEQDFPGHEHNKPQMKKSHFDWKRTAD